MPSFYHGTDSAMMLQCFARPAGRGLGRGGAGTWRRTVAGRDTTILSPTFRRLLTSAALAETREYNGNSPAVSRSRMIAMARGSTHCGRDMASPARVVRGTTCRAGTFRHHASLLFSGGGKAECAGQSHFPVPVILTDKCEEKPNALSKSRVNCRRVRLSAPPRLRECRSQGTVPAWKRAPQPARLSARPVSDAPSSCDGSPSVRRSRG